MKVERTEIPEVLALTPKCHGDARGYFAETYNKRRFGDLGIDVEFVQDNMSYSARAGTIRGLHYQAPPFAQAKLVRCTRGEILDVCVDLRAGAPTYGMSVRRVLSAHNMRQLFIPAGFAHGFSTLTPDVEVHYKVDSSYAPAYEKGIRFDDPFLEIDWQTDHKTAVVAEKDLNLPYFSALQTEFFYDVATEEPSCESVT